MKNPLTMEEISDLLYQKDKQRAEIRAETEKIYEEIQELSSVALLDTMDSTTAFYGTVAWDGTNWHLLYYAPMAQFMLARTRQWEDTDTFNWYMASTTAPNLGSRIWNLLKFSFNSFTTDPSMMPMAITSVFSAMLFPLRFAQTDPMPSIVIPVILGIGVILTLAIKTVEWVLYGKSIDTLKGFINFDDAEDYSVTPKLMREVKRLLEHRISKHRVELLKIRGHAPNQLSVADWNEDKWTAEMYKRVAGLENEVQREFMKNIIEGGRNVY